MTYVFTPHIEHSVPDCHAGRKCATHNHLASAPRVDVARLCVRARHVPHTRCSVEYFRRPERELQQGTVGDHNNRAADRDPHHAADGAAQEAEGEVV